MRSTTLLQTPGAGLWTRAALRRPGRGIAVVLGLTVMFVSTVAALVGGAALERLFIADATARWGAVDVVTFRPGEPLIGESLASFAGTQAEMDLPAWGSRLELGAVAGAGGAREPEVLVMGVSAEEIMLTPALQGEGQLDPLLLGPEAVILNDRLAERLGAVVGSSVRLVIEVPEHTDPDDEDVEYDPRVVTWSPTVEGIARDEGLADFGRTPNVITRLDSLQRIADVGGRVSALYVSAPGPGRDAAEEVVESFESINRQVGLVSVEVKEDALDVARDEGGLFSGILLTLALLVVAAGSAVTANLIILLGQERAREVAVLRASGLRQVHARRLFVVEAAVYAAVAAVIGSVLALPLASVLATAIADNFGSIEAGRGRELVQLDLTPDPVAILAGVLTVAAVALVTARAAARRLAGIDVAEVLRGGPPLLAASSDGTRRTAVTRGAGLLLLGMGLTASDAGDLLRFLGISLLLLAVWLHRRRGVPAGPDRVRLDERAAVAGLLWSATAPAVLGDFGQGVQSSFGLLTLAGLGAVSCATVLASARMPQLMRTIRLYLPDRRVQATLRTAGSYAGHVRSRSGTVVGTIAVVLFMVASLAVLGSATDIGAARQRGGFDVVGTAAVQVDVDQLASTRGLVGLLATDHVLMGEGWFSTEDDDAEEAVVPYPVRAVRVDSAFPGSQAFGVVEAAPGYATSQDLLDAVVTGDGVVLDRYARPEGAQVGDDVVIDDGRGPVRHELIGILDTFILQGVLMGPDEFDEQFSRRGPTFVLATAGGGVEPSTLAGDLAASAADEGLAIRPVAAAAAEVVAVNRAFTDTFALLLLLGLAVSLVAVAILVARAVRERRAALSVLRAIGFTRRDTTVMLVAEPMLEAVVGVLIGVAVGLGVLYLLFLRGFSDLAFVVGWQRLGIACGAVLALVLLCSIVPAVVGARRGVALGLRDLG